MCLNIAVIKLSSWWPKIKREEKKELKKGGGQGEEEGRVESNKFVTNVMIMCTIQVVGLDLSDCHPPKFQYAPI